MESKAKLLGHPVHQMLIVFPLGLLATSVFTDMAYLLAGRRKNLSEASRQMLSAGLIGGLAAAPFGLADWLAIPSGTRAKSIGLWHGVGNLAVMGLFGASWLRRRNQTGDPDATAILLSVLGGKLSVATGWLGGELVDRLGVGVDDGAHLDAPSSLSGRPASENEG